MEINEEKIDFSNTPEASRIKKVDSEVTVELIKPHISNDKKEQAQIRMEVKTTYPEAGVGNSLNDSIFGVDEFGFGDGQDYVEKRVGWIDIPKGTHIDKVRAQLKLYKQARIYRVMSLEPILTDQQIRAMETGISKYIDDAGNEQLVDMDYYRRTQAVIIQETGEQVFYKNMPQYRVTAFSINGKADVDLRPTQYAQMSGEEFVMNESTATQVEKVAEKF